MVKKLGQDMDESIHWIKEIDEKIVGCWCCNPTLEPTKGTCFRNWVATHQMHLRPLTREAVSIKGRVSTRERITT